MRVWMREAYRRTRKDAAAGVDGVTAAHYEAELEANLSGLLERFKSGRYRAPAVRRVHLEKPGTSKTRPIGIPTLEEQNPTTCGADGVGAGVTSRTFWNARTDSGRGAALTKRYKLCGMG